MLQFEQNTPGGMPQGLAALVQELIGVPLQVADARNQQQAIQQKGLHDNATLAEMTRAHMETEKGRETGHGIERDKLAHDKERLGETQRHNRTVETNSVNNNAATNARTKSNARARERQTLRNTLIHARGQQLNARPYEPDELNILVESILGPEEEASNDWPELPTAELDENGMVPGMGEPMDPAVEDANIAAFGAANGVPAQAAPLPQAPNPAQTKLLHDADRWLGLPSLVEGDKQMVRNAIAAKDFDMLAKMSRMMQSAGAGNQ